MTVGKEQKEQLLFEIELNIYRFSFGALQNIISQQNDVTLLLSVLRELQNFPASRFDVIDFALRPYEKTWDAITTRFFTKDYSRTDLTQLAVIFRTFSTEHIMLAIGECDPGKPLAYLAKILERLRSAIIPMLRRDELYARRVNLSLPMQVPQFRSPGYVSNSIAEELFFRAIQ